MNELCNIFSCVQDGQTLVLEKDKIYHVYPEDSVHLTGYFCTNTAKKEENPLGERDTPMYLFNKKNITIDGNGAAVIIHGKMTPFVFDRCENITVRNLKVDYAVPTMTEFTVLSNRDGVCEIAVNPACLFRVDGNDLYWCGETAKNGSPYWENRCNAPKRFVKVYDPVAQNCRDFRREDLTFTRIEQVDAHILRVTLQDKNADFVPGHIFQTRNIIRDQSGSLFQRCKNLYFENLRICFMHGLGMVSQFCENVTFCNCDFTPAEGRTIASTADFFQFSGCKGNITVDGCKAHGAQDDYINAHGTHLQIVEADNARNSLTVRFMHPETWGLQAFEKGDEIAFIRWDTLIPYAENTVRSYEKLNDTDICLYLEKPLPDGIVLGKDAVENVTWSPSLYVYNCDFGVTAGRGILCTVRGEVIIENNRFYHLWGPALLVEDDCNFWFESGLTNHITFRNNTVIGCNYGQICPDGAVICYSPKVMNPAGTAPVHGKLTLTGNTFTESYTGKHTFCLPYLRESDIADNTSDAPIAVIK
ncbi:MAG: right-handed parallel beta-helix repeat-containing protein [Ruminococcaceae bacterium]|nr:right-handed parallel beta-helix repeat-containing protein [Oscillospiraceae bacterium]